MLKKIYVVTCDNALNRIAEAKAIAAKLNLHYLNTPIASSFITTGSSSHQTKHIENPLPAYDFLLVFAQQGIGLKQFGSKKLFRIDFTNGQLQYRSQHATNKNELLARAIGVKAHQRPTIIDATAGLGRDSFILASLGFSMILLEREPIIHLLLADAILHAKSSPHLATIMERLHLIEGDAIDWLPQHQSDVVYLDPMFPVRQKSASVKKPSAILQELLPLQAATEHLLFDAALTCATKRVVIKRPKLAASYANQTPSFTVPGKSCRFDVYLV